MAPTAMMAAMENLSGRYAGNAIHLAWKCPQGARGAIHICNVAAGTDGKPPQINANSHVVLRLGDCPTGFSFRLQGAGTGSDSAANASASASGAGPGGVSRKLYFVCLGDRALDVSRIGSVDPRFLAAVIVGDAQVSYCLESKPVSGEMARHAIRLRSDSPIAEGILQYRYDGYGRRIAIPLPGAIPKGRTAYHAFYAPNGAAVHVEPVDATNPCLRVEQKKPWLGAFI